MFVLSGTSEEPRSFGSVDYWLRLRVPMTETIRLYKEKVKAVGYTHSALSQDAQVAHLKEVFHFCSLSSVRSSNIILTCSLCMTFSFHGLLVSCSQPTAAAGTNFTSWSTAAETCGPDAHSCRAPTWSTSSLTSPTTRPRPSTTAATPTSTTSRPTASPWMWAWTST